MTIGASVQVYSVFDLRHQELLAMRARMLVQTLAHLLEQLFVPLPSPLIFPRRLDVVQLVAQPVLVVTHHSGQVISLISLPLRAFSTVASNFDPRSTPICLARFFAHNPTWRESRKNESSRLFDASKPARRDDSLSTTANDDMTRRSRADLHCGQPRRSRRRDEPITTCELTSPHRAHSYSKIGIGSKEYPAAAQPAIQHQRGELKPGLRAPHPRQG